MVTLILAMVLACQDEAAATTALDAFGKSWSKEKSPDARAAAVAELAKTVQEKVCAKLSTLLTAEDKPVRVAAAAGLGTFTTTPELRKSAAKGLTSALSAGANVNDPEAKIAILTALGQLNEESTASKVRDHFEDKDVKVAAAAVTAAGNIKSKTMVDPLIALLRECEQEQKKLAPAPPPPFTKGKPPPPPPALPSAQDKAKRDRSSALLGAAQSALANLTGQSTLRSSEDFEKWWSKNRSNFPPK